MREPTKQELLKDLVVGIDIKQHDVRSMVAAMSRMFEKVTTVG